MPKVLDEHRGTIQVIDWNIEIALNLRGVQIKRERAAGARGFDQVCDELRGDWNARLVFAVLACVAVVGQDGGHTPGGGAVEFVPHQQSLQQVPGYRVAA